MPVNLRHWIEEVILAVIDANTPVSLPDLFLFMKSKAVAELKSGIERKVFNEFGAVRAVIFF